MIFKKNVAIAKITDPQAVRQQCTIYKDTYEKGAIYCNIPELGWSGTNYIYCRYGLSIPYLRVQPNWKLLVEPSIIEDSNEMKRWFYTGIVDCGGAEGVTPDTDMQMLIQLVSQVIYASGTTLHLSAQNAEEPLVLGNTLKIWTQSVDTAIKGIMDAIKGGTTVPEDGGANLKTTIVNALPAETEFPDGALSEKVFTE